MKLTNTSWLVDGPCYTAVKPLRDGIGISFIQSGFSGVWIKVTEDCTYNLSVEYATNKENKRLDKLFGKEVGQD
jgi:hypothetical protein